MNRQILIYLIVIAGSAAIAVGVATRIERDADSDPLDDVPFTDIDDPLWYRHADREVLLAGARRRLDTMTSTAIAAAQAGPVKDDVALLCRHEFVVDLVVEAFRQRKKLGASELSAFMEIFSRVRHEKFGMLLVEGLSNPRFEARVNAYEAALVQLDPATVPFLERAYGQRREGFEASKVISALGGIGTDDARAVIARAVSSEDSDVAVYAIREAVVRAIREAIPGMRSQLDHVDDMVCVTAAWGLAEHGQSEGRRKLVELVRRESAAAGARSQGIQFLRAVAGAETIEVLRDLVDDPVATVAFEARAALAMLRDPETLRGLREKLRSPTAAERIEAVVGLAISGNDEDVDLLIDTLPDLDDDELHAAFAPLRREKPPGAARFMRRLVDRGGRMAELGILALGEFGESGVEQLAEIAADAALDRDLLGVVISALGSTSSRRALEILEGIDVGDDRRLWLWLRNHIRAVDLRLMKE